MKKIQSILGQFGLNADEYKSKSFGSGLINLTWKISGEKNYILQRINRPGWFYHASEDSKVKSPQKLMDIYYNSVGKNCVLLLNIPPDKNGLINENDIKALQGWKQLRDETFTTNLLQDASAECPNGVHLKNLFDTDYNSYFTTRAKDTLALITIDIKEAKTFDVLLLQENIQLGQRVEKFRLEYWNGNEWKTATEGTTIGYKRLLRFPSVTTSKVRLRIESARLNPAISTMGLYKQTIAQN